MRRDSKRLGRGLSSLISSLARDDTSESTQESDETGESLSRSSVLAGDDGGRISSLGDSPTTNGNDLAVPVSRETKAERQMVRASVPRETSFNPASRPSAPADSAKRQTTARPLNSVEPPDIASSAIEARHVEIGLLRPNGRQPRITFSDDSIAELAKSVGTSGIVQPIVVRQVPGRDGYEIVVGERRWRAAKAARLQTVPVLVRQVDDARMLEWALIENIHREDLNAVDRAEGYKRFCDHLTLSTEAAAARLGEDRSTVANYLRLLDLPTEVRRLLTSDRISMGHARALLGLNDALRMKELAAMAAEKRISVRALEEMVRRERAAAGPKRRDAKSKGRTPLSHILDLEHQFQQALGVRVHIHMGRSKSTGRLVIEFYNLDDFDRIKELMGVKPEKAVAGQ